MNRSVPPLNLSAEYREIAESAAPRVARILESGRYILGAEVDEFERRFAKFIGARYAVGVASGSDAILLALLALNVGPGDEVITTPFTFFATASSIVRVGAKPVFADIEPDSFNIDPNEIEKKITSRTKAVLIVHLYGNACNMDAIMKIIRKRKLHLIEDCAQSCGTKYAGRKAGSFGSFGAFSFYPTKNLAAAGDAGAIVTSDKRLYEKLKSLHIHGEKDRSHSYLHIALGINSRLDELQAAVLNAKLHLLNKWNQMRREAAGRYGRMMLEAGLTCKDTDDQQPPVILPQSMPKGYHVYHQYTLRAKDRDGLLKHLKSEGISAGIYYPIPMHLQPALKFLGYALNAFPVAEKACTEVVSLPIFPQIKPSQQIQVIKSIKKYY